MALGASALSFSFGPTAVSGAIFQFNIGGKGAAPRVELSPGYNPDPLPVGNANISALLSWRNLGGAFRGREAAISELRTWAETGPLVSVRVLSGEGGVGKTALAARVAHELNKEKWSAGFARPLNAAASYQSGKNGTLLIIDYPEQDVEAVKGLLQVIEAERATESFKKLKRFRILLLSREPVEAWLDRTGLGDSGLFDETPFHLGNSADDAYAMFDALQEEANRVIDVAAPRAAKEVFLNWYSSGAPENQRPLYIAAAAVHQAVHRSGNTANIPALGIRGRDIVVALAERELQKLRDLSSSATIGLNEWALPLLSCCAAITGGLAKGQLSVLHDVSLPHELPPASALLEKLDRIGYWRPRENTPGDPSVLPPPEPDVLAAALVVHTLRKYEKFVSPKYVMWVAINLAGGPFPLVYLERLIHDAETTLAMGEESAPVLSIWLEELVDGSIEEDTDDDRAILKRLDALSLREATPGLIRALIKARRHLADKAIEPSDKAHYLHNLAADLSVAGLHSEAFDAIKAATEIRRGLAARNPGRNRAKLAISLNNLALTLSSVGSISEALAAAQEATNLYRGLADANAAQFAPTFGTSLNTLSGTQAAAGLDAEALISVERAVEIWRDLAAKDPARYRRDLARGLNNLSNRLTDMGRPTESLAPIEEAVTIYRVLATASPERHAPGLATCLNNLAARLAAVGRNTEALAAVKGAATVYRGLAMNNPTRFGPDLALSLNNLSNGLLGMGQNTEGLAAIEQAIIIRRELAEKNHGRHGPDLAASLQNLSNCLSQLGRATEALAAIEEAVAIYRDLTTESQTRFAPALAMSVNNLANRLSDAGRSAEAITAIGEALAIFRELSKENPARYLPELANSLGAKGNLLRIENEHLAASAAFEEGAAIILPYAESNPDGPPAKLRRDLENSIAAIRELQME